MEKQRQLTEHVTFASMSAGLELSPVLDLAIRSRVGAKVAERVGFNPLGRDGLPFAMSPLPRVFHLTGRYQVKRAASPYFGGEGSQDYAGPVLEDPDIADLCVEIVCSMLATGDHHHSFFEGFNVDFDNPSQDGVLTIRPILGS
jgi:hypothetical protein